MNELSDRELDEQLRSVMGSAAAADFDAFCRRHADAVALLNPLYTAMVHRRRRMFTRIASLAGAAAILAAVATWLLVPRELTFAQTVQAINKAKTISWSITWYDRIISEDGKRTWLRKAPRWERAWMAPSRYRDTKYDDEGNIATIDIEDLVTGTALHLDMKKKAAMLENKPVQPLPPDYETNPFAGFAKILENEPIEFVGQRDMNNVKVNAFRYHKEFPSGGSDNTEIWLDAKSKQFVGYSARSWFLGYFGSKNDYFDPATAPDRDNQPEPKWKRGEIAGVINGDIAFDAQLDPSLFSLTPPEGFTIVEPKARPKITEEQLIEWLRVTARVNDSFFVDSEKGLASERQHEIYEKPKAALNEAEQQYDALVRQHINDGNHPLIREFAKQFTEPRSFRYLGKGVKLGSADRIVCYYKLKSMGKYRAIYGDLTVKDVNVEDLPLPVEE